MALNHAHKQVLWLRNLVREIGWTHLVEKPTVKRTYEKVADYGCSRIAKVAALTTVPPTSPEGHPNGRRQNGVSKITRQLGGSTLLEMTPSKRTRT